MSVSYTHLDVYKRQVLDITDTNSLHRMNCIKSGRGRNHSYGQYAQMFIDVKDDVDYVAWAANDDDDEDRGNWPEAIYNSGWNNPQEIYLISHDKQRRMLIRRVLKNAEEVNNWTADLNSDGIISNSEKFYTLQVLQLRWFDAGMSHTFDPTDQWVLDWKIDTWACDASPVSYTHLDVYKRQIVWYDDSMHHQSLLFDHRQRRD